MQTSTRFLRYDMKPSFKDCLGFHLSIGLKEDRVDLILTLLNPACVDELPLAVTFFFFYFESKSESERTGPRGGLTAVAEQNKLNLVWRLFPKIKQPRPD